MARLLKWAVALVAAFYLFWIGSLFALRTVNPPTTGVQIQRRIEAKLAGRSYKKRYKFVSLDRISLDLQHAVIAAEDGHFYKHHGIDWEQVEQAAEESRETGKRRRGASTITQQLVKNLFFTTYRDPVRKAFEYTLAPLADSILGKRRELELYLNIIEWAPGVYGAAAAAEYYYHTSPAKLDREQAARLAACVPSPRRRKPAWMNQYSALIMERMHQHGW
ncbi:MAG: monofunctional biosynthetic peptidoglycan transglycosylase [Bryobacterales bacterium]|nr:monofunctional biosynthetic peptidoglycan transglycosylase [Bryobacterales bacterium]MBV9397830.1 monofunctional biosynthetic peptidoglycan transglycosylase [Bryobacterales bacterium]